MAENLFLRLFDEDMEWLLLDEATGVVRIRGKGSVDEFRELTSELDWSGAVYAMLAGESVLLTSGAVPSKQKRQILQAVPWVVEEKLATDVEDCHFAIGDRLDNGEVSVAVVERELLAGWLDRLGEAGIHPRVMAIDTLLVPDESATTVLVDGQRILVRTGKNGGFAFDRNLFAMIITMLETEQTRDISILVHPDDKEALQLELSQIEAESDTAPQLIELEDGPFETLCRNFDQESLDLLQGEYTVEEERTESSSVWRSAAILAACAFVLHLLLVTGQGVYLDVQGRQYESQAMALYQEVFPGDRNVRDIRRRWQAHLSGELAGEGGDFMDLFAQTARNLPGSNLVLTNVNYNQSRGDMILQLQASDSKQMVLFVQTLTKMGLDASVGTINQDGDQVNGSVKVGTGSAS
ncbi:MAG: type II secretion system protein GspL [Pseudomonadales bacterium]|nr:type II secretion system protein GspL [Pseudomonadales bacterium]